MKKYSIFLFLLIFISLTFPKQAYALTCPEFTTSPSIPTENDDIILLFDNSSVVANVTVDGTKTFTRTQGTNNVAIGRYSAKAYRFEVVINDVSGTPTCYKSSNNQDYVFDVRRSNCSANAPQKVNAGEEFSTNATFTTSGQVKAEIFTENNLPKDNFRPAYSIINTVPNSNQRVAFTIFDPGRYRVSFSTLRPVQSLCTSNVIEIVAAPTPTLGGPTLTPTSATACTPPDVDPNNPRKCLDPKCIVSNSAPPTCIPAGAILPTSVPIPTPTPTTPPAPPFPCATLVGGECKAVGTAIGNIDTDPASFIKKIFTVLLSMAGGWAVYLIVTAGYQLMFSQGDAEGVKEAQEKITSAIVGIVFMILSLIILRVIGVDIFGLPTFGQ